MTRLGVPGIVIDRLLANAVAPPPANGRPVNADRPFRNFEWRSAGDSNRKVGRQISELTSELFSLTDNWPRRVGDGLFVVNTQHEVVELHSVDRLFAWMHGHVAVEWAYGAGMVNKGEFYAQLQLQSENYNAVETVPHFPPLAATYYAHHPLPDATGEFLESLVDRFCPATPYDRELIKALILSLFWGGPPGTRPAWLITAQDDDASRGRGVGKSKLISLLGRLVGGFIEISPNEDIVTIRKRLLSPEALPLRMARIDNVKTSRFSWADLEALITSSVISGHRMYQGEGRRPNTLNWILTVNGASMSQDMSERCQVIELRRPAYTPTWEAEVRTFIDHHRWQIVADIGRILHGDDCDD